MNKRNLKRAIAKFEELAADEEYEGNHKIINLDKFLESDLSIKKKKKKKHLESTPIKSIIDQKQDDDHLNNTFDDDESSNEIKTADEFLKRFISQPSLLKTNETNRSSSKSTTKTTVNRSNSKSPTKSSSSKNKSPTKTLNKTSVNSLLKSPSKLLVQSPNKSSKSSQSILSKSSTTNQPKTPQQSKQVQETKRRADEKLKELENKFMSRFQQRSFKEDDEELDDEEYDDEDEEYDDEDEEFDEELDEEYDENSNEIHNEIDNEIDNEMEEINNDEQSNESLDDESIDPESSELVEKQLNDESLDDESKSFDQDEELINEQNHMQRRMYQQQSKRPIKQTTSKSLCKLNQNRFDEPIDYITNFEYQKAATEELYKLILKEEDCSYNILTRLIENIKQTLNQNDLPNPSMVKPFFHFTPENQIHVTFLFINPKEIYYNPWESIITQNYSNLNNLFEKIYELIFNFHHLIKNRSIRS